MRGVVKNIIALLAFAAFISLFVLILVESVPEPPVVEMAEARESLSDAAAKDAGSYSGKLYGEARVLYDSAMATWKRENRKFIYFRDYDRVVEFASQAERKAVQAAASSRKNSENLEIKLKHKIDSLNRLILEFDRLFRSYPLTRESHGRFSKGKMLLKESELAYGKKQFLQSNIKMTDAEYLLTSSYDNALSRLRDYFSSFPDWEAWLEKTIDDSKRHHSYSIIVDKYARKCYIYLNGNIKHEFDVELGRNWVGDKRQRGDMATPEGMYKVTRKFDRGRTKYYKALLIDYPNENDKLEFKNEIEAGTLDPDARIGSMIEIHGNGGRGIDWTEGCIAVTDKEMDTIFRIATVGTPVTIVGSMRPLREILAGKNWKATL